MRIYIYFLELHFVGVYSLIVLVYSNRNNDAKKYNDKKYYLPKFIIKNYNAIINGKNCYDQPIDSDIKWDKKIKSATDIGEDYTTEW